MPPAHRPPPADSVDDMDAGSWPSERQLLIDTDIGTDVDDALALATILGSGATLHGCTTSYGDTVLRARIVKRLARLAGREVLAVPGAREPLSDLPVWWAGHEGKLYPSLEAEPVDDGLDPGVFLSTPVLAQPGRVDVLCLAPLANLAGVLEATPDFARKVRRLVIMGGRWWREADPEHNFASDPEAAAVVFASGAQILVIGLDTTMQVTLDRVAVDRIAAAGPLGEMLAREVRQWLAHWNDELNTPHDAVAATALLEPGLFTFTPLGTARIATGGMRAGTSAFTADPAGTVRVATALDVATVTARIIERICRAGKVPGEQFAR